MRAPNGSTLIREATEMARSFAPIEFCTGVEVFDVPLLGCSHFLDRSGRPRPAQPFLVAWSIDEMGSSLPQQEQSEDETLISTG